MLINKGVIHIISALVKLFVKHSYMYMIVCYIKTEQIFGTSHVNLIIVNRLTTAFRGVLWVSWLFWQQFFDRSHLYTSLFLNFLLKFKSVYFLISDLSMTLNKQGGFSLVRISAAPLFRNTISFMSSKLGQVLLHFKQWRIFIFSSTECISVMAMSDWNDNREMSTR